MLTAHAQPVPGTLRQVITVRDRFRLVTDEPQALGGDDDAPSPYELVPAALASCVSVTLAMYARRKGWDLGEISVDVAFDPKAQPRRFVVEVTLHGELDDAQIERLESVAATCPVRRLLEGEVEIDERLRIAATTGRR